MHQPAHSAKSQCTNVGKGIYTCVRTCSVPVMSRPSASFLGLHKLASPERWTEKGARLTNACVESLHTRGFPAQLSQRGKGITIFCTLGATSWTLAVFVSGDSFLCCKGAYYTACTFLHDTFFTIIHTTWPRQGGNPHVSNHMNRRGRLGCSVATCVSSWSRWFVCAEAVVDCEARKQRAWRQVLKQEGKDTDINHIVIDTELHNHAVKKQENSLASMQGGKHPSHSHTAYCLHTHRKEMPNPSQWSLRTARSQTEDLQQHNCMQGQDNAQAQSVFCQPGRYFSIRGDCNLFTAWWIDNFWITRKQVTELELLQETGFAL